MNKERLKEFAKAHQQKIALIIGFIAVAAIGFYGGLNLNRKSIENAPVTAASSNSNYNENQTQVQTVQASSETTTEQTPAASVPSDCNGKIKGSSSHKYHLPGGAFYDKTTHPIACFDTEEQAKAAGFVKSSR